MAKKPFTKLHDWQQKKTGICEKCKVFVGGITVDHIIPVAILDMWDETGNLKYEWDDNFQYLCRICNTFKSSRLDKRHPKTKRLLLELLEK